MPYNETMQYYSDELVKSVSVVLEGANYDNLVASVAEMAPLQETSNSK